MFRISFLLSPLPVSHRFFFRVTISCCVNSVQTARREWQREQEPKLREALRTAAERAIAEQPENQELKCILKSTAERQLDHGLSELLGDLRDITSRPRGEPLVFRRIIPCNVHMWACRIFMRL